MDATKNILDTQKVNDAFLVPKEYHKIECTCLKNHKKDKPCKNLLYNTEYIFVNLKNALFNMWPKSFIQTFIDDQSLKILCGNCHFDHLPDLFKFCLTIRGRRCTYTIQKTTIFAYEMDSYLFTIRKMHHKKTPFENLQKYDGCWRELKLTKSGDCIGKEPKL